MANGYASVATPGKIGEAGRRSALSFEASAGRLRGRAGERAAGDGGESSSASARGASIGLSIKLADWSSFLNFVGQRPMMQWMAERRGSIRM
uniref:Uncharacterized protein n=1 Tax=Rhizobium leguminosarum TaxID=384 RepID=A0A154IN46_RHILE|nr:hypothetical protein A4A59_13090 [Rhizobium leguminosarum]